MKGKKLVIVVGQRFGRLITIEYKPTKGWLCRCDCGKEKIIKPYSLISGNTTSCTCLRSEQLSARNYTHRKSKTAEYRVWSAIKKRCFYDKEIGFKYYGGRGITMCSRWRDSFEAFLHDMGPRPSENHFIDRIDVAGNYEPSNCRWATRIEQANNKRRVAMETIPTEILVKELFRKFPSHGILLPKPKPKTISLRGRNAKRKKQWHGLWNSETKTESA